MTPLSLWDQVEEPHRVASVGLFPFLVELARAKVRAMVESITAWVFAMLVFLSPAQRAGAMPGWEETSEAREARYWSIAADARAVVFDAAEAPLPGLTRDETMRVVLAIAHHESGGFAKDVDVGPCYTGPGYEKRCDSNRSVCLMQILTEPGARRDRLRASRVACFREGLMMARASWARCREPERRLNQYATGSCAYGTSNTLMKLTTAWRLRSVAP